MDTLRKSLLALIAVIAVVAGGVQTASAGTVITCPEGCSFPYQRWVDEAKVPTPDVTLTVVDGSCPNFPEIEACTVASESTIWMNVTALREAQLWPREAFYHELGHNFDYYDMTQRSRHRFRQLRHSTLPWVAPSPGSNEGLGEAFAESYMSCALDKPAYFRYTPAAYSAKTCRLIRSTS